MKNFLKILLGAMLAITVAVVAYAVYVAATQGGDDFAVMTPSISANLMWGYVLVGVALASAVFSALYGMLKSSGGLMKTLLSFGLVVAVILGSYFIASSHSLQIPNIGDGGFFEAVPTVISETSIYIAYVAMAGVVLASIASEVINAFK